MKMKYNKTSVLECCFTNIKRVVCVWKKSAGLRARIQDIKQSPWIKKLRFLKIKGFIFTD